MGDSSDLDEWAASFDLTADTIRVLKDEGFSSLKLLLNLTPDDVTENFQKTKILSLGQSKALKAALTKLGEASSASQVPKHLSVYEAVMANLPQKIAAVGFDKKGESFRFLMVGKTGAGKSTTGNTILGEELFDSEASFNSVTDECQLKNTKRNDVTIEILDSPGLFDTRKGHEAIAATIIKSVACMTPGPHAILYVVKIDRYTEEEEGVYNQLLELFDKHLASYTIVVFTGGDSIKPGQTVEELLANAPESMKRILSACQNRYVVFNNRASDKQPQVDVLLSKVRELVAENSGKPYTCPKYFHIGEAMEQEVMKRMAKVEKNYLKNKQYVQELQVKTKQAEDAVIREKEDFKKREEVRAQELKEEEKKRTAQLESLKQQLEQQQQINEEKRRQETEAFIQKMKEEREQQMKGMEKERKREQEELLKKEKEMSRMMATKMEEEKKMKEEMARAHEEEMRKLKEGIADEKGSHYMETIFSAIKAIGQVVEIVRAVWPHRI